MNTTQKTYLIEVVNTLDFIKITIEQIKIEMQKSTNENITLNEDIFNNLYHLVYVQNKLSEAATRIESKLL